MKKIVVVEDDPGIRGELSMLLYNNHYEVHAVEDFASVLAFIEGVNPDLVLLDVNLPGVDGFALCAQIRSQSDVPIIFVSGRSSDADELSGIALGGDDFITKPYNPAILLARVGRILARSSQESERTTFTHRGVALDVAAGEVSYGGQTVELTPTETKIMYCLFQNRGNITLREKIMDSLWSNSIFMDDNALSVNITRIREKLAAVGLDDFIITRRGKGYLI